MFFADLAEESILQSIQADALIASDIHLSQLDDERGQLLMAMLKNVEQSDVGHLILLGDIFDFCLGSHPFYQRKYKALGESLERCVASGTQVVYVEGNHEFRLQDFGWKGVEFFSGDTTYVKLRSGQLLQLGHGDLIFSHSRYKAFRRVVKSRWFTTAVGILPGRLMDYLARKAAETSRAQDAYRTIHHDRILGAAYQWLEAGEGDYGLFGHFHIPYAEARRDGKAGGIYSMDCWDQPNFLLIQNGDFYRLEPELTDSISVGSGLSWRVCSARSYFSNPQFKKDRPEFVPLLSSLPAAQAAR